MSAAGAGTWSTASTTCVTAAGSDAAAPCGGIPRYQKTTCDASSDDDRPNPVMAQRTAPFRRPISLKVYSIALGLLALMVLVSALSAHNLKSLNNEVAALAKYYLPLDQQVSSVDTLIRQQNVHFERILLLQQLSPGDKAAIARASDLFDQ